MADTYEKDLAQKSSLTTGDFIRVVGSDNVSYKQVLTSVLDTFNTNLPIRQLSASSFANLDTQLSAISADIRYFATVNGTDGPNSRNRWTIIGFNNGTSTYAFQWAMTFDGSLYERHKNNSSTWSTWVTQPTRAEVDALASDSGWLTLVTGVKYRKVGKICYVNIEGYTATQTSGAETIGTLPTGYRPTGANIQWAARKGTNTLTAGWLTPGGVINYTAVSASGSLAGFICFPVV